MYLQIVIIIILIIIIFTIIAYYDSNKQFSSYANKKEIKTKTNEDSEEEIDYDDTIWKSLNEPWWNQQIPIFIYSNNIYRGGGMH